MNYQIVNAFSKNGQGGNPAAVVINHPSTTTEKQDIAQKIGFSETAFLTQDADGFAIEFFTPEKPIPYCGHATIAAVNVLLQNGTIAQGNYRLATQAKAIDVNVTEKMVYMKQEFPIFHALDQPALPNFYTGQIEIKSTCIARNGVGFVLSEASSVEDIFNIIPNQNLIKEYSEKHDLVGNYLFALQGGVFYSRMFAPFYGIEEENATGMAAGLLGGWAHVNKNLGDIVIQQGGAQSPKGFLFAKTKRHQHGNHILVGGEATIIRRGAIE